MKRRINKKFCQMVFLLLMQFIVIHNITGQTDSIFEKEKNIKLSNLYYWGEAANKISDAAQDAALADLNTSINIFKDSSRKILPKYKQLIHFLDIPIGSRTKSIAYILKSDVTNKQYYNDGIAGNNTNNNENKSSNSERIVSNSLVHDTTEINTQSLNNIPHTGSSVEYLLRYKYVDSLLMVLSLYRQDNKLMYGNYSDFAHPEQCYLAVFDSVTNKMMAFLDKGSNDRTNLYNGSVIHNYKNIYSKMKVICIQIY